MKKVVVSGGFDPIHVGHIEMIQEAKKLGDYLVVVLNGDSWLERKKGKYFIPVVERAKIVMAIKGVDEIYIHNSETNHICEALKIIKPDVFANGGDRKNEEDIPEAKICKELNIEMVFNVGKGGKIQSSSELLANWKKDNE